MSFTIFTTGTTANASEVMANFYHIADGDRLPRTGVSLTAVDLGGDLGSPTYKWDKVYTEQLDVSYSGKHKVLLTSGYSNGINTTTTEIQIVLDDYDVNSLMLYTRANNDTTTNLLLLGLSDQYFSLSVAKVGYTISSGNFYLNKLSTFAVNKFCESLVQIFWTGYEDALYINIFGHKCGNFSMASFSGFELFSGSIPFNPGTYPIPEYLNIKFDNGAGAACKIDLYYELWMITQ